MSPARSKAQSGSFQPDGILLRSISRVQFGAEPAGFPFTVPVIQALETLEFTAQVTFFIGENGSGKSTLLEAIAAAAGSITVGSEHVERDKSLSSVRELSKRLRLAWSKRTKRGFFMRSEDFFGYARRMSAVRDELQQDLRDVDDEYKDRSDTARAYARLAYESELGAMRRRYGDDDLDARSHGESYLKLFQARFVPEGLYMLDEPEAPLSPLRQLSFLALLKTMLEQHSQFIIATHSPILMAYPGAKILSFDNGTIRPVDYEEVEHVRITRAFLDNPRRFLDELLLD